MVPEVHALRCCLLKLSAPKLFNGWAQVAQCTFTACFFFFSPVGRRLCFSGDRACRGGQRAHHQCIFTHKYVLEYFRDRSAHTRDDVFKQRKQDQAIDNIMYDTF